MRNSSFFLRICVSFFHGRQIHGTDFSFASVICRLKRRRRRGIWIPLIFQCEHFPSLQKMLFHFMILNTPYLLIRLIAGDDYDEGCEQRNCCNCVAVKMSVDFPCMWIAYFSKQKATRCTCSKSRRARGYPTATVAKRTFD